MTPRELAERALERADEAVRVATKDLLAAHQAALEALEHERRVALRRDERIREQVDARQRWREAQEEGVER